MSAYAAPAIRPAMPHEAGMVRGLVRAAYAPWVPVIGREPRPMTADYARALREHDIALLEVDGGAVALIETVLRDDHLWIENVAVRPEHQGRGYGRRLLAHAECRARAAGRRELRLLTNAAFIANIALYERLGYRINARDDGFGGTVYMRKTLAQ